MLHFALVWGDRLQDHRSKWHLCCPHEQALNEGQQRQKPFRARSLERNCVWVALIGTEWMACVYKKICIINQIILEIIPSGILL